MSKQRIAELGPISDAIGKLAAERRQPPPCLQCIEYAKTGGPSHDGSRFCESGSIASGGTKAHCTCDTCF